jgi:hypothetical protein
MPAAQLRPEGLRGRELYQAVADRILDAIRETSLSTPFGRVQAKGQIFDREIIIEERLR